MLEISRIGVQYDLTEHLNKAAIGVIGEAFVARQLDQPRHRFVVDAQVQHGIHHARHGKFRARTYGDQQGVILPAKAFAGLLFQDLQRGQRLLPHARWEVLVGLVIGIAGLGGDGESGRNGQPCVGHFGHARSLATQQIAHFRVAFTKEVDPFSG